MGLTLVYKLNGKVVSRKELLEAPSRGIPKTGDGPVSLGTTAYRQPLRSYGMGVQPGQAKQMHERLRQAGVTGCEVKPDGKVFFTDRGARRRALRALGMFDRDGGYRD
jgi:hypothetical protein